MNGVGGDELTRFERLEDASRHLGERPDAVDAHDEPPAAVRVEDRRRLALVDRETVGDHLFGVVGAALVDHALPEAGDALLARHDELDHGVERLAARGQEVLEVVDLGAVAREPVAWTRPPSSVPPEMFSRNTSPVEIDGTSKAPATSTPCVPLPEPCGPTIRKRAELLAGTFPKNEYAARVVALRERYPLLSLPIDFLP